MAEFNGEFGYLFSHSGLLVEALTHRSYIYSATNSARSNERLEFLGDSVLGLIVSEHLFRTHPDFAEGDLTKTKALLVNEITLSKVAIESKLNRFVLMSPEEEKSGGRERNSIVSDAVEAVIGAIYVDGGLESARQFIRGAILSRSREILSDATQRNYKGELLELMQSKGQEPPYYEVVSEEGPDHEKIFTVVVRTNGEITGTGMGSSKKEAEQQAACLSLQKIKPDNDNQSR